MPIVTYVAGTAYRRQTELAVSNRYDRGFRPHCLIKPEPSNIVDPDALIVNVKIDGRWRKLGYIPKAMKKYVYKLVEESGMTWPIPARVITSKIVGNDGRLIEIVISGARDQ